MNQEQENINYFNETQNKIIKTTLKVIGVDILLLCLCLLSLTDIYLPFTKATIYIGFLSGITMATAVVFPIITLPVLKIAKNYQKRKLLNNKKTINNKKKNNDYTTKRTKNQELNKQFKKTPTPPTSIKSKEQAFNTKKPSPQTSNPPKPKYSYQNHPKKSQISTPEIVIIDNKVALKYPDGSIVVPGVPSTNSYSHLTKKKIK